MQGGSWKNRRPADHKTDHTKKTIINILDVKIIRLDEVNHLVYRGGGGGTRYNLEWGGAARPLKPLPCLRQKLSDFFDTLFKTFSPKLYLV